MNNYGRGGKGNDAVLAEAQQPNEQNNASFAPTPEGTPPHIRVGVFTMGTTSVTDDRDADYDGQVLFHESGHGVSNRLVGALVSTSCLSQMQSGAMGEGWSDYFSISFFDNPVEGAYVTGNATAGVRRFSYEGYPYTYEDLGNQGYEVHNDGEIWAATLWDLRKSLGQAVADQLVLNGLKSTPCNPSMTDARDAILAADVAANGGANRASIWQVFAKHGMGYSALGVDGTVQTGERYDAAYDQPPDLQTLLNPAITSNPLAVAAGVGIPYPYQVTATNPNGGALRFTLTSGPAGMAVGPTTGLVSWIAAFIGQRVKITVTDGMGGKVVHGYYLPVLTSLTPGSPVTIAGPVGSAGFATVAVPANTPVLQVTLRNGTGDAIMAVTTADDYFYFSERNGNTQTLSFANPAAGSWQIEVDGLATYSGVSLAANLITPTPLDTDTTLSNLSGVDGSEAFYRITIPAGKPAFSVAASGGTGDANLYLRRSLPAVCQPLSTVYGPCSYDKASTNVGNADALGAANPGAGDWYLAVFGYAAYSGMTLTTSTGPVSIATTSPLPAGSTGIPYSQAIGAAGGVPPYAWSMTSGSLPDGLALVNGTLRGTPTTAGVSHFTLQATDSGGATASAAFTLTVIASPLTLVTPSPLLPGVVGSPYSQTLGAIGGTPPYTWSVTVFSPPAGLTLGSGGTLYGVPTAAGAFGFTVQVMDSVAATAARTFALTVGAVPLIVTVAGTGAGAYSGDGGTAVGAQLYAPFGVTLDGSGNLYVADSSNNSVRKVTPSGVIDTVAGAGVAGYAGDGGPAIAALLNGPSGVALDSKGNLYIADALNERVRKVTPGGVISTVAGTGVGGFSGDGGPAAGAQLYTPYGVAVDASGNLYIADWYNNRVRMVSASGIMTTVAGSGVAGYAGDGGPAAAAQLDRPFSVALDGQGNLYVADQYNNCVRKISAGGIVSTVAGNGSAGFSGDGGPATAAALYYPHAAIADGQGNLYITDSNNNRIRRVSASGIIATVAGTGIGGFTGDGGPATMAWVNWPHGLALDALGNLYIGDSYNNRVREIRSIALPSLSIAAPSPLPTGVVGIAYSQTLGATGGSPPYAWSVTSGALPAGLALGGGTISGTPTVAGSFRFTVQVNDSSLGTATATLSLTISPALAIATSSPLLSGFTNGAFSQTLTATGGAPPYVWSLASGALPAGLTLSGGGTISGTPTAAGTANFTVQVRDGDSSVVAGTFALTVIAAGGTLARVGVLSQFAAGGGWDTTIYIISNNSAPVHVRLVFYGDNGAQAIKTSDGNPALLTVTQQGDIQGGAANTLDRVVDADTTLIVGGGLGSAFPVAQGWVDVLATAPVSGYAVFRYATVGLMPGAPGFVTPYEGTVPLQSQFPVSTITLPFDNSSPSYAAGGAQFATGIAIGSLTGGSITATFFDVNGR